MNLYAFITLLSCILTSFLSFASSNLSPKNNTQELLPMIRNTIVSTWWNRQHYDIYFPSITWHNRWMYDNNHLQRYNEQPGGVGCGISELDKTKYWRSIYLIVFLDSFSHWQQFAGYAWEAIFRPKIAKAFHVGAGYTAGITIRKKVKNHILLPVILPLASVGYGSVVLQMIYVPGSYNNGNVYFAWVRLEFNC